MSSNKAPILEVDNLAIDFLTENGPFSAVAGISFNIEENESVVIIGESGSGKSVTANAILGLIDTPPAIFRSGAIRFHGTDLLSLPERERRGFFGKRIAMVFQDPMTHLNPVFTVGWQISEVCRIHGATRKEARQIAMDLLQRVGIPEPHRRIDAYPHQFSGGQRQRIMIAMAIAKRPELLVADEPTTALDVTVQAQILDLLREIQAESGMSLLMITHDLRVAAGMADRVMVMNNGVFVESGTKAEIFSAPKHPYTKQLLVDQSKRHRPAQSLQNTVLLEASALDVSYGEFRAVRDVHLTLSKGEVLGIVGESGSGKSTLAKTFLRLQKPTSGAILYRGQDIANIKGAELRKYRRSVQAVFQDPFSSLNPRMTVLQLLAEPWNLNPEVLAKPLWPNRAGELLEMVGLKPDDLAKYPAEFSGGQRQRIAIARSLALNPEIIVLDEAVSALDMTIQAQVMKLLSDLSLELELTYIFIAHDLTLTRNFADRLAVMKNGVIVEQGPIEKVFTSPQHPYTRQLLAAADAPVTSNPSGTSPPVN